jgi:hypothetical protein
MREQAKAVAVAEFLAPEPVGAGAGGDNSGPATPPSAGATTTGIADAPVIPAITSVASPAGAGGRAGYPTGLARFTLDGGVVNQPGSFYSLSRGLTDSPAVPILEATNSSLTLGQNLMEISGATFSSTGAAPLLYLDPTTLNAASLLTLSGGGQFNLVGSLFQDQNGTLALSSDFLRLSGVGTTFAGSGASALVDLVGSSASTAGGLLSVSSGAVMDLVKASAPLLSLTRNAALVTGNNLADISGGATVTLSQLASLSASNLVVQGHALSLSGGARMTVAGDLFRLADRSTLTIANGALLSLSGGAIMNVGGALINFIGTGNTLNITNTLCGGGCTMVGGLPVLVTGGGTLTLTTNPILNLTGNVLNIAPGAAAITISGGAQVKQGP